MHQVADSTIAVKNDWYTDGLLLLDPREIDPVLQRFSAEIEDFAYISVSLDNMHKVDGLFKEITVADEGGVY